MNIASINRKGDIKFWQLSSLNDLLDALASPKTERASELLNSNCRLGKSVDLIASLYSPSLSYAEKLKQTLNYLLDIAYRRDPEDMIMKLIPTAARKNPESHISFIRDVMEKYLARYETDFGTERLVTLINKIEQYYGSIKGSTFPKVTACIEPIRAECLARSQTPTEQFLTYSSIARFGVDPNMANWYEESRDMDSHNRLRNYGLKKSMELLPRLDTAMIDSTQCLAVIQGAAHFYLAETQNVNESQQAQIAPVMDKAWTKYFEMGGRASAVYKELRLAVIASFQGMIFAQERKTLRIN